MSLKPYLEPKKSISRGARLRNRCIALLVFAFICVGVYSCLSDNNSSQNSSSKNHITKQVSVDTVSNFNNPTNNKASIPVVKEEKIETPNNVNQKNATPEKNKQISKVQNSPAAKQKNSFLAEKIESMLQAFKPKHAMVLVVDAKTNEIISWVEQKEGEIQNKPDYLTRSTFPAASLAKTVTLAAALESKQYSLNTEIPLIGNAHHLYKNQLKVPKNYKGTTVSLQDAYARSYNPPLGIVGTKVGAKKLKDAAQKLGFNTNFPKSIPHKSHYAPPDTGYGLAETSCGFTDETTLSPLLAAAQIRAVLTKKKLEIPWSNNLEGYAPKMPLDLDVGKFSENTYYGLRQAMLRSVTHGTARKNISTKHIARKNYNALNIGGKTGSLDGKDPYGRYDWFAGFAQSKENPDKAIILVVMQVYDPQGIRPQPTTQVSAMIINYWAHQTLWGKE